MSIWNNNTYSCSRERKGQGMTTDKKWEHERKYKWTTAAAAIFLHPNTESKPESKLENKSVSQQVIKRKGRYFKFTLLIKSLLNCFTLTLDTFWAVKVALMFMDGDLHQSTLQRMFSKQFQQTWTWSWGWRRRMSEKTVWLLASDVFFFFYSNYFFSKVLKSFWVFILLLFISM